MDPDLDAAEIDYDAATGIATVTLDRPDSLNAIDERLASDVVEAFAALEARDREADGVAVRVVTVEGAGDRAFSSGADIGGFADRGAVEFASRDLYETVRSFPAPVVAAIDGYCLGGGLELAFACDFRLASERSRLGQTEVDVGLFPGAGGMQYLTAICGPAVAKEVAMFGEHIPAERAAELGLVHRVYPDDAFGAETRAFVEDLAAKAPLAVRAVKDAAHMALQTGLSEGYRYDRRLFANLLGTEDFAEGAAAFREDRTPSFQGR